MFVRFDDAAVPGSFSTDGYIDAAATSPTDTANLITLRLRTPPALPSVYRPIPHDKKDTIRLVCALPRGVLLVEHLEPESNHLLASYFDYIEGWRHGTHYHASYRRHWERDGAIEQQCYKVGIPKTDWSYSKWAFLFLMEVREAESIEQVGELVDEWCREDRPMRLIQPGNSIDLADFESAYPELRGNNILRDLVADMDELLETPNLSLQSSNAHEEIFSLRLRVITELPTSFGTNHPTYIFMNQLLDQYAEGKSDHELRQWLQVVKRAILEIIRIKTRENLAKPSS